MTATVDSSGHILSREELEEENRELKLIVSQLLEEEKNETLLSKN